MVSVGSYEMAKRAVVPNPPTYLQQYTIISRDEVTYPQNWKDPFIREPTVGEHPKIINQAQPFRVNPNSGAVAIPKLYPKPVNVFSATEINNPRDWKN